MNSERPEGTELWITVWNGGNWVGTHSEAEAKQMGEDNLPEPFQVQGPFRFFTLEELKARDREIARKAFNAGRCIKIGYPDNTPETHYSFCDVNDYLRAEGYLK